MRRSKTRNPRTSLHTTHHEGTMRIRTWLSRACAVAAVTATALAVFAPASAAQERPAIFESGAFATPIQVAVNTSPQTFVADLVRLDVPHGEAALANDGDSRSRAASVFPGLGAQEGPSLGWGAVWGGFCAPDAFPCEEFPGLPPANPVPPYPLTAQAEYPTQPEATPTFEGQVVGSPGDPVSFRIVDVRATATAEEASTVAVINDLDLLPVVGPAAGLGASAANASAVHVGSLRSTTRLHFEGHVLVAEAESRLGDISLFGGAVQIEQLVTRSVSRHDGGNLIENEPSVTVTGATLDGHPVKITEKGLVAGDGPQDQGTIPMLSGGIGRLFGADSASVRLIETTTDMREGSARSAAVGLAVHLEADATGFQAGTKVLGDLVLGTASTSVFAGDDTFSDGDVTLDDEFDFEDDFATQDFGDGGGFDEGPVSVAGETADAGDGQVAAPQGGGGRTVTRFAPLEALLSGVAANRVELLYLAWTFTLMALAFGSRLPGVRLARHR